jgi:nucleotide-binding universal stress UspA family protein
MYQHCLVPTDGSQPATQAAEQAFELANLCNATVHILHVLEPLHRQSAETTAETEIPAFSEETRARREQAGEQLTAELADQAAAQGLETQTAVTRGVAHETILDYAADHEIDLIVIGTQGRGGIERWLLGSVTERVIRHADVPVHVVRVSD